MTSILNYMKMIKIEHSLFALPFALSAMILAARGLPSLWTVFWILVCMVAARSGAMGFNRWADAAIDARNPRTANREIPAGRISSTAALLFVLASFAIFIFGASRLNHLSFMLSPIPIAVFILYSYTKRFTSFCHLVLGISLGLAPVGAWIAVTGSFNPEILYLAVGVVLWCGGFDLFYALQDLEFDRRERLHSIPAKFGPFVTQVVARYMHFLAFIMFFLHGAAFSLGAVYFCGLLLSGILLLYQHHLVFRYGLTKLNKAFFSMNALISIILFIATVGDLIVYGYRG